MVSEQTFIVRDRAGNFVARIGLKVNDNDTIATIKSRIKSEVEAKNNNLQLSDINLDILGVENDKFLPKVELKLFVFATAKVVGMNIDAKVEEVVVKIEPDFKVDSSVYSEAGGVDPNQDAYFCFDVDLNRPKGLRDDFAEQAVNQALQKTFEEFSAEIDKLPASEDSGATLTVCASAKLNVGVDFNEIKADASPLTVVTAQLGDSKAHLITGTHAKLLAPIHRITNKTEKTRVDRAIADLNNRQPAAGEHLRPGNDERTVVKDFNETYPTRVLGMRIDRDNYVLSDKPEISVIHLAAKQSSQSEVCLTTDGVWESVADRDLVSCSAIVLCKKPAEQSSDDLTAVKVLLSKVPVGKIIVKGISDGNGQNGEVVSQYIANNFQVKFSKNIDQALNAANKAQKEFKLNNNFVEPKAVIENFIKQLTIVLAECDNRLGPDHNHQGVEAIKKSLAKIKSNQNNPWAELEKLGKEIYQQHYGFFGTIKKYTRRDLLVHEMYSILKQLGKQHCNDSAKSVVERLELLAQLTVRMQAASKKIEKIERESQTEFQSMLFRK